MLFRAIARPDVLSLLPRRDLEQDDRPVGDDRVVVLLDVVHEADHLGGELQVVAEALPERADRDALAFLQMDPTRLLCAALDLAVLFTGDEDLSESVGHGRLLP